MKRTRITGMTDPDIYKRSWSCPAEDVVAAYVDQAVGATLRMRLQRHFSKCAYCRNLVADVVKLNRINDLDAPSTLVARVRQLTPPAPKPPSRWLMPLTAAGSLACVVITLTLLHTEQTLKLPVSPAPAAPEISKPEPM